MEDCGPKIEPKKPADELGDFEDESLGPNRSTANDDEDEDDDDSLLALSILE